jgi:hypothetical protein
VPPRKPWQLRTLLAFAALCTVHGAVRAQELESLPERAQPLEELPVPATDEAPEPQPEQAITAVETPGGVETPEVLDTPVALETPEVLETPVTLETPDVPEAPEELAEPLAVDSAGIRNRDVQAMVEAEFSDSTIVAVINANDVQFDLSPRALVALKGAGVSEPIIEAMIAAEAAKESAAKPEPEPTSAELAETQASLEYARLTAMIEQLAAKQEQVEKTRRVPEPPASRADPAAPRVWLIEQTDRAAIAPTIAQVAFAGSNRRGERMKNLQGLANQALAFASPAVSGIATTIGGLFRPDENRTAVWALAAPQSSRVLDVAPVFEIDYAHIPGVDPDRYQPAIVQLVPTNDNYRLVAAAETEDASKNALPRGPIIEESIAADSTRLGRGQYRVAPKMALGPGEYALVLRPLMETRRERRRDTEASLGELLGGSTSQILYLTWDFSVASETVADAP